MSTTSVEPVESPSGQTTEDDVPSLADQVEALDRKERVDALKEYRGLLALEAPGPDDVKACLELLRCLGKAASDVRRDQAILRRAAEFSQSIVDEAALDAEVDGAEERLAELREALHPRQVVPRAGRMYPSAEQTIARQEEIRAEAERREPLERKHVELTRHLCKLRNQRLASVSARGELQKLRARHGELFSQPRQGEKKHQ